ncbi:MAG TPA: acyltransferase family protein [Solimonas sp.]|nr:acyltransferase family protein [Solimonas sp.]
MNYRRDIDGLRAVAVVPVVLFHAFPELIPGGFVGVDVFFVISGFLITGLLMGDLDRGRFSLLDFYERRARRILPALSFVLLFCVAVSALLYVPVDFWKFSGSLLATGGFASNVFFWRTSGYFAGDVGTQPLLHTWSLAVEEQFYLFFPPLLYLLYRKWRPRLALVLAIIGVLSLLASWLLTPRAPSLAFYLLPTRAWELMLGALLAIGAIPASPRPALNVAASFGGLALILFAIFAYSSSTDFPGVAALAPALGAALVIYGGQSGRQPLRWLEWRPAVAIGLISYSLYLWHWPVLAMLRYWTMGPVAVNPLLAAVAFSTLAAAVSWRWIENPVRRRAVFGTRQAAFAAAAAVVVLTVGIGALGYFSQGLPQRMSPDVSALGSTKARFALRAPDRTRCLRVKIEALRNDDLCVIGQRSAERGPSFVLWGDSHAETFRGPLAELAGQTGEWGYFIGGSSCPPMLGVTRLDRKSGALCTALNAEIPGWLARHNIHKVVLGARWALYVSGLRYQNEEGNPVVLSPDGVKGNPEVVQAALRNTLETFDRAGVQTFIISGIPEIGVNVPRAMALQRHLDRHVSFAPTRDDYLERNGAALAMLKQASAGLSSVTLLHPYELLCAPGLAHCQTERDDQPLYSDDDHLSLRGAFYIEPFLTPVFGRANTASSRAAQDMQGTFTN